MRSQGGCISLIPMWVDTGHIPFLLGEYFEPPCSSSAQILNIGTRVPSDVPSTWYLRSSSSRGYWRLSDLSVPIAVVILEWPKFYRT